MGMLPSYIKLLASMDTRYRFEGPVCSLGNQDIWASHKDLKSCLEAVGCTYHEPVSVIRHSSRTLGMNVVLAETAKDFVHAKTMFEAMGVEGYLDMVKFDSDNPAVLHDLNYPIPADLMSDFGMVFDGGTIEHIFDVRQVMGNVVDMLHRGVASSICARSRLTAASTALVR